MARPVVALLSDFGTRDHYVGSMKAAVLTVCPEAVLVDIGHEIPAQDVLAGALLLAACYRDFPAGSVFLTVVDPGVGSARRGMVVKAGDYGFVAPDNGILTCIFKDTPHAVAVELTNPRYARPTVSHTFEGRDRFAPAAGWLANGAEVSSFGAAITDYHLLDIPQPVISPNDISGEIIRVDHFGNLISNIHATDLGRLGGGGSVVITVAGRRIRSVVTTYASARPGQLCALVGSSDHLEISVNGGSAAQTLSVGRGTVVVVAAPVKPNGTGRI